ncbi:hypothetical protein HPB52_006855 [Rhipicephalus sanguineus]|uniref:RING-type domain-containing protein n=1 Tax=Rhipicephalus sanguineus TaxID=34632 RepID=A0A9D4T5A2_RHISA|nr:hypothetical protein HPB52_006855 [Rhipicephalus sanguineus]
MADLRRVHRFRDHPIAGVNWRPTRFVEELPTSRVCGLCRMIPTRTVLLPCSHILCQSCSAASTQGGSRRCPLDQEPFEEAECSTYDLPVGTANALKVYCWNEAHGCEHEGAMEEMLQHFEKECTFHAVECLQCGEAVLHSELATHCVAGCSVCVASARRDNTSSESEAVTTEDVRNALEDVSLLRDSNLDQVLPSIQSQVNELTEQVGNQETSLAEVTGEARSSLNAEVAEHAATASSAVSRESASCQNSADEASTSTSSLSCRQELMMNPKPEIFSDLSPRVLEQMRKTSTQDFPQHFIEYCGLPEVAMTIQAAEVYEITE